MLISSAYKNNSQFSTTGMARDLTPLRNKDEIKDRPFIDLIRDSSGLVSLGATMLTEEMAENNWLTVFAANDNTAHWGGGEVVPRPWAAEGVKYSPRQVGVGFKVSFQDQNRTPNATNLMDAVAAGSAARLGNAFDRAMLAGEYATGEPSGLIERLKNAGLVQNISINDPTDMDIRGAITRILPKTGDNSRIAIVCNFLDIQQPESNLVGAEFGVKGDPNSPTGVSFDGWPVLFTELMPKNCAIVGDWSKLFGVIGDQITTSQKPLANGGTEHYSFADFDLYALPLDSFLLIENTAVMT